MNTNQLKYYFSILRAAPFMPLLYFQANQIKNMMPDMPAPEDILQSDGPDSFHILGLGESSIASIGVKSQAHGIIGFLAEHMRNQKQQKCSFEVVGVSGYTVTDVKEKLLPQITSTDTDLIVIGLGANDSFQLTTPKKWHENISYTINHLQQKYGSKVPIIFMNMPPILEFPIFTPLLKYFLHRQLKLLKRELVKITDPLKNVFFMSEQLTTRGFMKKHNHMEKQIDDFYSDGVHPSKLTYNLWAREILEFIDQKKILEA